MRIRMRRAVRHIRKKCGYAAWWFRQVLGDAAYENYLRSANRHLTKPGGAKPLTAEEFYLDALRRRYSGVSRCC